jgi:hypothetical protein
VLRDADLDPLLTPEALTVAPELASLALLERALDLTQPALIAAHPELHACLDDYPQGLPWDAQTHCAVTLMNLTARLRAVLRTYYRLILAANGPGDRDDIPF